MDSWILTTIAASYAFVAGLLFGALMRPEDIADSEENLWPRSKDDPHWHEPD